jgi:hypothetical protein
VRPSQEWIVATLLDIQSKLDRLLPPPGTADEARETPP